MSKSVRGPLLVLACFTSWGLLPIFWKLMGFIDSTYIMLVRLLWSAVFYGVFILVQGKHHQIKEVLKNKRLSLLLLIAGLLLTANWWIFIYAVSTDKLIEASLAYYINPLLAVLAGHFFFREHLSKSQWLATALAAIGIGYSIVNYGHVPWLAIFIGVSFTLYGALKKMCDIDGDVSIFMETAFVFPFGLAFLIFREAGGSGYMGALTFSQYAMLPLAGLVTAVPLLFYARGIKNTSLTMSGVLMFVNPTLQLIIATAMYGEKFLASDLVMFPCVWIALIIYVGSNYVKYKARQKNPEAISTGQ